MSARTERYSISAIRHALTLAQLARLAADAADTDSDLEWFEILPLVQLAVIWAALSIAARDPAGSWNSKLDRAERSLLIDPTASVGTVRKTLTGYRARKNSPIV